jgi:hypothetical protein
VKNTIFDKNGKSVRATGYRIDFKKNKIAEKELNKGCNSLENILESMNDAFIR